MQARSTLSCGVCLSVCPSVTFVDHVKTNKHIFENFPPSGSDTILVFPYQRGCRYSDGNSPNGGVECSFSYVCHGDLTGRHAEVLCSRRVRPSVHSFVFYHSCDRDILKTNEAILMPLGVSTRIW